MEVTSICPYCGKEMRDGAIPSVRDTIRWCRKKEGDYGDYYEEGWGEGVLLGKPGLFSANYTPAYYCEDCRVMILPVPELESLADKAGRLWENTVGKTLGSLGERIDRAAERREEKRTERKREEKRKKDPWEV